MKNNQRDDRQDRGQCAITKLMTKLAQAIDRAMSDNLYAILIAMGVIEVLLTPLLLQVLPGIHAVNIFAALFAGVAFTAVTFVSFCTGLMFNGPEFSANFGDSGPLIVGPPLAALLNSFVVAVLVAFDVLTVPVGILKPFVVSVMGVTAFSLVPIWFLFGLGAFVNRFNID